ncbi:SCO4225 family membrane protein [Streptomyces chartreusis]|uniref:SCO4225 family membrane protein n=1 Tax=Streptomyces chartreusis TaxID=1969 RepID=UPI003699D696
MKRVESLRSLIIGSWPSRIYWAVVAAAVALWLVASNTHDQPDASLAGVYPLVATSPVSIGLLFATELLTGDAGWGGAPAAGVVAMAVGAVVNAWLIGLSTRSVGSGQGR